MKVSEDCARAALMLLVLGVMAARAQSPPTTTTNLFSHAISRAEAVDIALRQNSAILKGKADLEAAHGVVVQLRSIAFPTLSAGGVTTPRAASLVGAKFPAAAAF